MDLKQQNEAFLRGEGIDEDTLDTLPDGEDGALPSDADLAAFAMEAQLRDFIIDNISRISIGDRQVRLYRNGDGREGKEYPTDVGPIDILAVDNDGNFFVFELKLSAGQTVLWVSWQIHGMGENSSGGRTRSSRGSGCASHW